MNEDEFFRIIGIDVKESDQDTSFYYEEYLYDDESFSDVASPTYDP
jgi:hypothetical protein|tara:strand:- start:451 stop:588 length:138 start_codon:yes stop_codon:yes gene_type:complete